MQIAEEDVVSIATSYLERGEFELAFKFIRSLLDKGIMKEKLQYLIDHAPAASLCTAKAQVELAELMSGDINRKKRQELRKSAAPLLGQCHHHLRHDIEMAEALEAISNSEGDTIADVDRLFKEYAALDYPNGYKKWLYKLLDKALDLYDYDLQHSLEVKIKELSRYTGTFCFSLLSRVNHVARIHQRSGHDDLVKNSLLELDKDLREFDLPFSQGQVASILTQLYITYKDAESAVKWANSCRQHWDKCSPTVKSMGHLHHLNALILRLAVSESAEFGEVQSIGRKYVDEDLTQGLVQDGVQKLLALCGMCLVCKKISDAERVSEVEDLLLRAESVATSITPDDKPLWASVLQSKANFYIFMASQRTDPEYEVRGIQVLQDAMVLTEPASCGRLIYQYVVIQQILGLLIFQCYKKLDVHAQDDRKALLESARDLFFACIDGYRAMSCYVQVGEAHYWVAFIMYEMRVWGFASSQNVLQCLAAAEDHFDARRTEISVSSGISAIRDKQTLAKDKHARDIYRFAIQVCLLDRNDSELWLWVQKAKARSLSDTLGLGCLIPGSLMATILDSRDARELYEEEQRLSRLLASDPSVDRFTTAIDLRNLQRQMEAVPSLRSLIDLRKGRSVTSQELLHRWSALPPPFSAQEVAFVDWYVKSETEIYTTVLRPGREIVRRRVNATTDAVRAWISRYIQGRRGQGDFYNRRADHPRQAMREMDCLVEAIGDHTEPGSLLVLSPSSPLEKVPLHALNVQNWVQGRPQVPIPLAARNPIVYCSNFTVFIQCCERATSRIPRKSEVPSFMAVYEGTDSEPPDTVERDSVYASTRELCVESGAMPITGLDVTAEVIRESWADAGNIFFHGHCDLATDDITKQSLILAKGNAHEQQRIYTDFTVLDVFELKLKSPLVTLMACGSSTQQVGAGDEPLGLVTSFLCAGAASVVGTVWPIKSRTARRFAASFYKNIRQEAGSIREHDQPGPNMIDLAVALQRTVQELRKDPTTSMPYHWAAFVLYGASFMKTAR